MAEPLSLVSLAESPHCLAAVGVGWVVDTVTQVFLGSQGKLHPHSGYPEVPLVWGT